MKNVLLSTRPQWCEEICNEIGKDDNGKPIYEKRIEVRKSKPSEVPFKAFIYCTNDRKIILDRSETDKIYLNVNIYRNIPMGLNGKVIGEFICDKVDTYSFSYYEAEYRINHIEQKAMCLNHPELIRYGKGKPLYGWHISDLKIYDKPRELSEFYTPLKVYKDAQGRRVVGGSHRVKRAPQSWCYVEG